MPRSSQKSRYRTGRRALIVIAVGGLLALLPAATVSAHDSGTVQATVTQDSSACLTIADGSAYDFGNMHFSTDVAPVVGGSSTSAILADCSGSDQSLFATFNGFTGPDKAFWGAIEPSNPATNPCIVGPDKVIFKVSENASTFTQVGSAATSIGTLAANDTNRKESAQLTMPCTGSSGASASFSGSVTFLAAIP